MNQIPHTIFAPRPNPGQVMRQAIQREDRKLGRRVWLLNAAAHAFTFALIVLSVFALSISGG